MVNNRPPVLETQETQVRSLGQEDPCRRAWQPHSSTLAWRIPRTEEPGGLLSMGSQRVRHDGPFLSAVLESQQTEASSFPSSLLTWWMYPSHSAHLVDVPVFSTQQKGLLFPVVCPALGRIAHFSSRVTVLSPFQGQGTLSYA